MLAVEIRRDDVRCCVPVDVHDLALASDRMDHGGVEGPVAASGLHADGLIDPGRREVGDPIPAWVDRKERIDARMRIHGVVRMERLRRHGSGECCEGGAPLSIARFPVGGGRRRTHASSPGSDRFQDDVADASTEEDPRRRKPTEGIDFS